MKHLLLIISLLLTCQISAQYKIIEEWSCRDSATTFKNITLTSEVPNITKGVDTTYQYRNDSLVHVRIECDTLKVEYTVEDGIWKWFSTKKTILERTILKDGRCNGITRKGVRCKNGVNNENEVYFCFWHK